MSSNRIRVSVRIRPEMSPMSSLTIKEGSKIELKTTQGTGGMNQFFLDQVFDESSTQERIFEAHADLIDGALEGYSGCILAYGQTGAGKTHTMTGPAKFSFAERGLCMRVAGYLFERARALTKSSDTISIRLSVLEIYNETLIDLLNEFSLDAADTLANPPSLVATESTKLVGGSNKLNLVDTAKGMMVPGLRLLPLDSEDDAYSLLSSAMTNRVVADHKLNQQSSRSHCVYTYYITRTRLPVGAGKKTAAKGAAGEDEVQVGSKAEVIQSKLHLVDLAGSERSNKTGSVGQTRREASHINKSLLYLEQVVLALSQAKSSSDHIPYRQSKLTYLLKDSIGGDYKTALIACLWPHQTHEWETLSTLRFAARMRTVENIPTRNSLIPKEYESGRLLKKIEELKRELSLRDVIAGDDPWLPTLTAAQKSAAVQTACKVAVSKPSLGGGGGGRVKSMVHPDDDESLYAIELQVQSLSHVKAVVGTLRAALWEACGQDADKVAAVCRRTMGAFNVAVIQDGDDDNAPGIPGTMAIPTSSSKDKWSGRGRGGGAESVDIDVDSTSSSTGITENNQDMGIKKGPKKKTVAAAAANYDHNHDDPGVTGKKKKTPSKARSVQVQVLPLPAANIEEEDAGDSNTATAKTKKKHVIPSKPNKTAKQAPGDYHTNSISNDEDVEGGVSNSSSCGQLSTTAAAAVADGLPEPPVLSVEALIAKAEAEARPKDSIVSRLRGINLATAPGEGGTNGTVAGIRGRTASVDEEQHDIVLYSNNGTSAGDNDDFNDSLEGGNPDGGSGSLDDSLDGNDPDRRHQEGRGDSKHQQREQSLRHRQQQQRQEEEDDEEEGEEERSNQQAPQTSAPVVTPSSTIQMPYPLSFDEFADSAEGAHLHIAYQDAKQALLRLKTVQRQLVSQINSHKDNIDEIQSLLESSSNSDANRDDDDQDRDDGEELDTEAVAELKQKLSEEKAAYRSLAKILQTKKKESSEMQRQKQQTLAALVQAFETYSVQFSAEE